MSDRYIWSGTIFETFDQAVDCLVKDWISYDPFEGDPENIESELIETEHYAQFKRCVAEIKPGAIAETVTEIRNKLKADI